MLLTPHVFVGLAIGATVPNPILAVPLSVVMHFVGDKVPHWDFFSNTPKADRLQGWRPLAVMADLIIGVAIGLTATYYALWVLNDTALAINLFLCGIASVLPDALEGPYIYMKKEPKILSKLTSVQKRMQTQAPLPWGLVTQAIVILVSLWIFYHATF